MAELTNEPCHLSPGGVHRFPFSARQTWCELCWPRRARIRSGAYDVPLGAGQLADRLGIDLRKLNGDLHLYVNFVGNRAASPADGPRLVMRRPGEQPPPAEFLQFRRANHFIRSADRRAGNVGYLAIAQLSARADEAFAVVDAAMSFLDRTDALIIDLRSTPGGDVRMSDYVASYSLGPGPVPTLNSYTRATDRTMERTTVRVNGRKRIDVPLFVLVGLGTASGAEDLAFTLKQAKRATLVGERTAGAGRLTALRLYMTPSIISHFPRTAQITGN